MKLRPRRLSLSLVPVLLLACGAAQTRAPSPPAAGPTSADLWIRDVTVVSPERKEPLRHAHVLLHDGRIAWVDVRPPPSPGGATVLDGAGRYLVPGLIDGHVHVAEVPGVTREKYASLQPIVDRYFQQLPRSYLYFGFTTVVDLGVVEPARVEALRGAPEGPAVLDCGGGLPIANGYPMVYAPEALRFQVFSNFLYDPRQAGALPNGLAPADHTPAAAVGRVAAGSGVCVKTYYEPGFGDLRGKLPTPTVETIRDVVSEAHRRRLPVVLHANSIEAHRFAVAAGVDATAHGLWNWGDSALAGDAPPDPVRAVLDDEIHAGIATMPTSRVISGLEGLFTPGFLDDPRLADVLPAELVAWYRSDAGHWFARDTARGMEGMPPEKIRAAFHETGQQGHVAARYFATHGGRLLFGSDTPSGPTYANPPGYNGFLELRELEAAGIDARAIFTAATLSNAQFFGVASEYGTVEPGKRANLLLLTADPLASTAAFDAIDQVIVAGKPTPRAELSARGR